MRSKFTSACTAIMLMVGTALLLSMVATAASQSDADAIARARAANVQYDEPQENVVEKSAPLTPAVEPKAEPKVDTTSAELAELKKAVEAFAAKTDSFAKSIEEYRKERETLKTPAQPEVKAEAKWLSYADAYANAKQGGPLVIVLGAVWCTGCQELKAALEADFAPNAHYCYVDIDEDPQTARQVMGGNVIPQVVVYELIGGEESNNWKCDRYTGVENLKAIKDRVCRGINAIAVSATCDNPNCVCDPCTCEADSVTTAYAYATETSPEAVLVYRAAPMRTFFANRQPVRTGARVTARVTARVVTAPVRWVRCLRCR